MLPDFRRLAELAEQRSRSAFEAQAARAGGCSGRWEQLEAQLREEVWRGFLQQGRLLARAVEAELTTELLSAMRRRGSPLRIRDKLHMLRSAVTSHKSRVSRLRPVWAGHRSHDEADAQVEQRLGRLEYSIEESPAGEALRAEWSEKERHDMMSRRTLGLSMSVDPALRVVLRPEGLGNLNVFASGPMGSPGSPVKVNIGLVNDGSMGDVYREHPAFPKITLQPALHMNVKIR